MIVLAISMLITSVSAVGDGNIDTGGGSMGTGSKEYQWIPGNDGVRITIVDSETGAQKSVPIDFSRKAQGTVNHFGKNNKVHYLSNSLKISTSKYISYTAVGELPTIVSVSGNSSIDAIKSYFCSEYTVKLISDITGFDYDELINGEYKLLIEPIIYLIYGGTTYCFTATEAALYDQKVSGTLYYYFKSLTHKNLPLAMFLETSDLGFNAWKGSKTNTVSNAEIISELGLGIVKFKETDIEIDAPDVTYRVNTEVITSVTITTDTDLTPDNPATVTFEIDGKDYTVNDVVIPANSSQIVWIKWTTPKTPQLLPIEISVTGASTAKTEIVADIVELLEVIPPDPIATDRNDDYILPKLPSISEQTTASWSVWSASWVEPESEEDEGYWDFENTEYQASIKGAKTISPDDNVPTAVGKNMKSGYGVKTEVEATVETEAPTSHFTYPQTAFSVFPEFEYETYLRVLEITKTGTLRTFEFKENPFSTYMERSHFTPVWFPDNSKYTIYTEVWDAWTPVGMLSINLSDYVNIDGSLFDDWYTNRE